MSLLPPFYLDCVVAIGVEGENEKNWIGTGFLFGQLVEKGETVAENKYRTWLITNKHVLLNKRKIFLKFNSLEGDTSKDYEINLYAKNGKVKWIGHPNTETDIAVIFINPNVLKKDGSKVVFFSEDSQSMNRQKMVDNMITEGDRVFVLGFPMGIVDEKRQYVFCRGGYLSRVRDFKEGKSNKFIVDATVFPGNSGGPVIICPSALAIQGTKTIQKADLIGIVSKYLPYQDYAISRQTGRTRVVFEENTGLSIIEPVDAILETVRKADKVLEHRTTQARRRNISKK